MFSTIENNHSNEMYKMQKSYSSIDKVPLKPIFTDGYNSKRNARIKYAKFLGFGILLTTVIVTLVNKGLFNKNIEKLNKYIKNILNN